MRTAKGAVERDQAIGSREVTEAGIFSAAGSVAPVSIMILVGFGSSRSTACRWRSVTVRPNTFSRAAGADASIHTIIEKTNSDVRRLPQRQTRGRGGTRPVARTIGGAHNMMRQV